MGAKAGPAAALQPSQNASPSPQSPKDPAAPACPSVMPLCWLAWGGWQTGKTYATAGRAPKIIRPESWQPLEGALSAHPAPHAPRL